MIFLYLGLLIWIGLAIYYGVGIYNDYKFGGSFKTAFWLGLSWPLLCLLLCYIVTRDFVWKLRLRL